MIMIWGDDGSVGAGKKPTQHVEAHTLISSHYVSECSSSFFRFVVRTLKGDNKDLNGGLRLDMPMLQLEKSTEMLTSTEDPATKVDKRGAVHKLFRNDVSLYELTKPLRALR